MSVELKLDSKKVERLETYLNSKTYTDIDSNKVVLTMMANNKTSTNVLAGASDYPVGEFAYILTCYWNTTIHNPQTSFKCIF